MAERDKNGRITMSNIFSIAKKEFADLVGEPGILLVLIVYVVLIVGSVVYIYDNLKLGMIYDSAGLAKSMLSSISSILGVYGSVIALMIGFASIANEKLNNALNTIITKPLYRDTIINGKLLGCICFLTCLFGLAIALYISFSLIIIGGITINAIPLFLEKLPVVFIISLIYVIFFLSFSMLFCLAIKSNGVALMLTILLFLLLTNIIPTVSFAGNLSVVFRDGGAQLFEQMMGVILFFNPNGVFVTVVGDYINYSSSNVFIGINDVLPGFIKLFLITIILIILTYTIFMRRDIA